MLLINSLLLPEVLVVAQISGKDNIAYGVPSTTVSTRNRVAHLTF